MRGVGLGLVLAMLSGGAHADTWADTTETDYPVSKALCQKLKARNLTPVAAASKAACDAEDLYYGVRHPADPAAARLCALGHVADPDKADDPFDGRALLVTIYANGKGAPRNLDIATAYACLVDGAPAEIDGRILHLQKLKTAATPGETFDFCDDATSGLLTGQCAARDAAIADAKRDATLAAIAARLTPAQAAAFARLRKTEAAYVAARGDNEVDMTGTARSMLVIGAQQDAHTAFMTALDALMKGQPPKTDTPFAAADKALNAAYGAIMRTKDASAWGTVEKSGIKTTQKTWLGYRDAFAAFGEAMAAGSGERLKAALTEARTAALGDFAP